MKFGHGELPLFNFLVRYSIDNPVCDNEFSWKKTMFCKLFAWHSANLSRAVSWPNAYLVGYLLELSGDCACDFLACMVMEESPKIPEKAAVIDCKNLSRTI
jgi:hypothetical protein